MKNWVTLGIVCVMWSGAMTYDAIANMNNEVMKSCLEKYGYKQEKFNTFDFSKPAACHAKWRAAETEKNITKMREFLKEHPWYKGENWQWEECAKSNRCTKRFSWWSTKEK